MVHHKTDYKFKKIKKDIPGWLWAPTVEDGIDSLHSQHPSWKQDHDSQ